MTDTKNYATEAAMESFGESICRYATKYAVASNQAWKALHSSTRAQSEPRPHHKNSK